MAHHLSAEDESFLPAGSHRNDTATVAASKDQANPQEKPGLRRLGSTQVRQRTGKRFTETIDDYQDIFQQLQVASTFINAFWHDVIWRYRQGTRYLPLLKRGTEASIKALTDSIMRAYGDRIWGPRSEWRRHLAEGEQMLLYEKQGQNAGLREILTQMWWRMRGLVFEPKPEVKRRGRTVESRLRNEVLAEDVLSDGDEPYLADVDRNAVQRGDGEGSKRVEASRIARAKALRKFRTMADSSTAPTADSYLTAQQTEDEIINLVERLHDLRLASNPDVFERLWAAHIGRAEELEAPLELFESVPMGQRLHQEQGRLRAAAKPTDDPEGDEEMVMVVDEEVSASSTKPSGKDTPTAAPNNQHRVPLSAVPFPVELVSDEAIQKRTYPNHSGEPFNSTGNPIPTTMTQKHNLPPTLPRVMSIWIMASPPGLPGPSCAYHHPAAPVQEQDMVAFFQQVMERAGNVADKDVRGYALSYGWCDVSRWIDKTIGHGCRGLGDGVKGGESEGERLGWAVFQRDLVDAAIKGVMVWRMKVLVVKN